MNEAGSNREMSTENRSAREFIGGGSDTRPT